MLITFGAPAGYALYLACLGRIPEGTDAGLRTLLLSLSALVVAVVYLLTVEGTFFPAVQPHGMGLAVLYGSGYRHWRNNAHRDRCGHDRQAAARRSRDPVNL